MDEDNASVHTTVITKKERVTAVLAECIVRKESDLGQNDREYHCITHLGGLLKVGDYVLGYDLTNMNYNLSEKEEITIAKMKKDLPDVILVRKVSLIVYLSCIDNDRLLYIPLVL